MPDRAVPAIPSESPATATTANTGGGTTSDWSNGAANGHTPDISPMSPSSAMRPPRSPSMPMMNGNSPSGKGASLLELNDLPVSHSDRSVTSPAPLMSSDLTRSPTAPNMVSQASSMSTMSKRSHLIREIANTERAHAHDLALIRDAYLLRHLRPASQHSVPDSSTSPGDNSDASIRNSVYTYQTAGTKRSSGHESLNPPWAASVPVPMTSLSKRSSTENTPYASLHSSTAAGSTTSFQFTPQPSPRQGSRTSSMYGGMPPPIGKPLSPADTKNVFLNLDQLAAVADELATAFEAATGEEVFGPGAVVRGGEVGTDRLGEVFVSLVG